MVRAWLWQGRQHGVEVGGSQLGGGGGSFAEARLWWQCVGKCGGSAAGSAAAAGEGSDVLYNSRVLKIFLYPLFLVFLCRISII